MDERHEKQRRRSNQSAVLRLAGEAGQHPEPDRVAVAHMGSVAEELQQVIQERRHERRQQNVGLDAIGADEQARKAERQSCRDDELTPAQAIEPEDSIGVVGSDRTAQQGQQPDDAQRGIGEPGQVRQGRFCPGRTGARRGLAGAAAGSTASSHSQSAAVPAHRTAGWPRGRSRTRSRTAWANWPSGAVAEPQRLQSGSSVTAV